MTTFLTLLIPLLGTSLGAAAVFFLRRNISPRTEKAILGFASGVMLAASVWSLLLPALERAQADGRGAVAILPVVLGFLSGIGLLLLTDRIVSRLFSDDPSRESPFDVSPEKITTLLAITLHNLPEGMAVGLVAAGVLANAGISRAEALALSFGIAVQNIPEGEIVSMPLSGKGFSRARAFLFGVLSGAVEPVGGTVALLFASAFVPLMPFLLALAAGAMIYTVAADLIPQSHASPSDPLPSCSLALGFALMMVLDVVL